jgi:hypothetical protein
MKRIVTIASAISFATAIGVASHAMAATSADQGTRIASQYATWLGGRSNADALVNALRTGNSVTLVTAGPDNTKSVAGFTAQTTMTNEEIGAALSQARSTLSHMGIQKPTAEQIQAALIGGEIAPAKGKARLVQGSIALRAEPTPVAAVAAR